MIRRLAILLAFLPTAASAGSTTCWRIGQFLDCQDNSPPASAPETEISPQPLPVRRSPTDIELRAWYCFTVDTELSEKNSIVVNAERYRRLQRYLGSFVSQNIASYPLAIAEQRAREDLAASGNAHLPECSVPVNIASISKDLARCDSALKRFPFGKRLSACGDLSWLPFPY